MTLSRLVRQLLAVLIPALLAGCGSREAKPYPVSGRVTKGGKPLEFKRPVGMVQVVFVPEDESLKNTLGKMFAKVEPNGDFKVRGKYGKGLPAGKYKICIYHNPKSPAQDELKGKFDEKNTPFTREVKEGDNSFNLDLDKPN